VVQADGSISYDLDMQQADDPRQEWDNAVRNAISAFSRQVGETSEQLSTAAQRFAADAMRIIDDATRKAEQSANLSRESAVGAQVAAAEVRQLTESVRQSLVEAVEQVKQESRSFFQEAVEQTEQGLRSSGEAGRQLEERLQQAITQLEEQVAAGREAAGEAMSAAQQAREAVSDAGTSREAIAAAEAATQLARSASDEVASMRETMARVEQAASEAQRRVGAAGAQDAVAAASAAAEAARSTAGEVAMLREVIGNAERAALEARQIAEAANTAIQAMPSPTPTETTISTGAQEVLERLEADYSLLTKLVQELHARIASLSSQTSATVYRFTPPAPAQSLEMPVEAAGELPDAAPMMPEAEDREETPQSWSPEVREAEPEKEPVDIARYEAGTSAPMAEPEGEHAPAREEAPVIGGRVLVSISPVPDFDRLLSLDGALGRMSGVGNVTLADYAKEEVTFRLEVDPPTSVDEFRERLSQSAGADIEVVTSAHDALTLRLAS
jgi:hypothetical protein